MTEENRLKEGAMAEEIRVVEQYSASIANNDQRKTKTVGIVRMVAFISGIISQCRSHEICRQSTASGDTRISAHP